MATNDAALERREVIDEAMADEYVKWSSVLTNAAASNGEKALAWGQVILKINERLAKNKLEAASEDYLKNQVFRRLKQKANSGAEDEVSSKIRFAMDVGKEVAKLAAHQKEEYSGKSMNRPPFSIYKDPSQASSVHQSVLDVFEQHDNDESLLSSIFTEIDFEERESIVLAAAGLNKENAMDDNTLASPVMSSTKLAN